MDKQHHAGYVSHQDIIHKCFLTYYEMFPNMQFQWYVQNVYDSANRKGYIIDQSEVETTVKHFLEGHGRKVCPHCLGKWQ